jgi:predicted ATPase/tetratricopeptide (TPR) repeat protein
MNITNLIRTPDQRLRIFVSSTLRELADERIAVREAISQLRMAPVMFELGARPHPAINLYRAYLEQSHIFVGIYWQSYGYVAPDMEISGLEDEYRLAGEKPKLIYIKSPAAEREAGLTKLLNKIKKDDKVSYKYFSSADELRKLVEDDLALLLTERFEDSELNLGIQGDQTEAINNNLPAQVTSFVGREAEIKSIKNLLEGQTVRLLTLTGPGGTGKTRLSLQVASRLLSLFRDGVFFISLAEAHEPALVISKIAELLGVREGGSQSLFEGVKNYLRNKQLLLILDNFEQVLDAAPVVTELLESAPQLKVLVTSRVLLNLHGENEYPVPTLQLPESDSSIHATQLADYEAIQMFVDRAKAANPHLDINDRNAPIIADICRRLDGLPLAIELAAARVKMLSPEKLLSLLNSRIELLIGGGRDMPARQQTLRNTLEWSMQLLNAQDQALFARLGVFMGGFSLESAQEICQLKDAPELDIFQGVESLLNNSLVKLEYPDTPEPRFRMLETIREFASEKLAERGELEALQHRHAQYLINKMYEVQPLFSTREADRGLAWVDHEHDNLRAALGYCFKDDSLIWLAPWLMMAMNWPWYRRGFLSEGRDWANRLLQTSIAQEQMIIRCYALWCSGAMAMWQGDLNHALSVLEEAVVIAKSLEEPMMVAVTLLFLGTTQVNRGEDKTALKYLQEARELYEQLAMPWYQAITLVHMGNASLGMGDSNKARAYLDQANSISQQIGENWLNSFILNNYGEVARTDGDYQKAQEYYEQSERLLISMGDKGDLARLVHNLGCVARHTGSLSEAEDRFKESLGMFIKLGNQRGMAECLASLAGLWTEQGQFERAAKMLGAAQALLEQTGAEWWPADRGEVERNLETVEQSLLQAQFDSAWESGTKMNLGAAIAYANEGKADRKDYL